MAGWVKLYRQALENGWLRNPQLWSFWCYCLLRANYKPAKVRVGYQEVSLDAGQFIFGRKQAAADLGLSENVIRTCLNSLISSKNVTCQSTNKFSIITVVNWSSYQSDCEDIHQELDQQPTNSGPAGHHRQKMKKGRLAMKANNARTKATSLNVELPPWVKDEPWEGWLQMRTAKKVPNTSSALKLAVRKLEALRNEGNDPAEVLEQATLKGWTSLYAVQAAGPKQVKTEMLDLMRGVR